MGLGRLTYLFVIVGACSFDSSTAPVLDDAGNLVADAASLDAIQPDAEPATDADPADASMDAAQIDASVDAAVDAAPPDAAVDAAPLDAAVDAAPPDATVDADVTDADTSDAALDGG